MHCLTDNYEDVRMLEQHHLDARSIIVQHEDGFQNIPVFRLNATKSYSEDCPDARSRRPNVDLIKIELRCFWKDIAENRLDGANFCLDARQPESIFQQI
jgi:hypothetical protein